MARQSGKRKQVVMRHACNGRLREAVYHWARVSVVHDERSAAAYALNTGAEATRTAAPCVAWPTGSCGS